MIHETYDMIEDTIRKAELEGIVVFSKERIDALKDALKILDDKLTPVVRVASILISLGVSPDTAANAACWAFETSQKDSGK